MGFESFHQIAPVAQETISRFEGLVPAGVGELWRSHGAGFVGDGYFRLVDPDRALKMLDGVLGLPAGAVPVLVTGLADLVFYARGMLFIAKLRYGVMDLVPDLDGDGLVRLVDEPGFRDSYWQWQPYPAAVLSGGVPDFEKCYGFVPLLAIGGREDAVFLKQGGLWEHIAIIAQLAGQPKVRTFLDAP